MEFNCPNCDEYIDIPNFIDVKNLKQHLICHNCFTFLNLENLYTKCSECSNYFLNHNLICPCCRYRVQQERIPDMKYVYVQSIKDYKYAINYLESKKVIGVDTEGNSLDPHSNELLLLQVGDEYKVFLFDYKWYKKLAKERFWHNERILFVFQNAKFDQKVLLVSLGLEVKNIYDTMLAERLLTCGIERNLSLKALAQKYLGITLDKEIREDFRYISLAQYPKKLSNELLAYSALDVQILPIIYRLQKRLLENEGMYKIAVLEFRVSIVLSKMEVRGLYLDKQAWEKIIYKNKKAKQQITKKINKLLQKYNLGEGLFNVTNINLNSSKEILTVFRRLDIPLGSTGDRELSSYKHPFTTLLIEQSTLHNLAILVNG